MFSLQLALHFAFEYTYIYTDICNAVCVQEESDRRIIVLNVEHGLQFPGMEYFKDKVAEKGLSLTGVSQCHICYANSLLIELTC